jgi:hypothetical protein
VSKLLLLCLLACAVDAVAQPVILPSSLTTPVPAATDGFQAVNQPVTSSMGAGSAAVAQDPPPFQWGAVELRPHLSYRLMYGDGIQSQPGNQLYTAVHTISPGVSFKIGDSWTLDYTATQTLYSRREFNDTLDQAFDLQGTKSVGSWALQFAQGYTTSSAPLAETASQTKQENATTSLGAAYPISPDFSLELGATQSLRFAGTLGDTFEWSTMDWVNYHASTDFSAAVGAGLGYVDLTDAPNMSYQRYLGRMGWKISPKIGLDINGGVEVRNSEATGASATNNPIYDIALRYAPFEHTTLSVEGGRTVSVSLFQNQVSDARNWSARLQQRLLGRLNLNAGVSGQKSSYSAPVNTIAVNRDDETRSFNVSLGATFRRRGTIVVSYQRSQNTSNLAGYGFSSSQFGLELAFRY